MPAHLLVIAGPDKGRTIPLNPGETLQVGRGQAASARLADPAVSSLHCDLEVTAEQTVLNDRSKYGSFVNGQKVAARHVLKPGDVIRLGGSELRYVDDAGASTLAPPRSPQAAAEAAKP